MYLSIIVVGLPNMRCIEEEKLNGKSTFMMKSSLCIFDTGVFEFY